MTYFQRQPNAWLRLVASFTAYLLFTSVFVVMASQDAEADIGEEDAHLGFLDSEKFNEDERGPNWITRNLVVGKPILVCSPNLPLATQKAVERWNAALGIIAFTVVQPTACDTERRSWMPQDGVVSVTVSLGRRPGQGIWYYGSVLDDPSDPSDPKVTCSADSENIGECAACLVGNSRACAGFDHMTVAAEVIDQSGAQSDPNADWQTYYGRVEIIINPTIYCRDIMTRPTVDCWRDSAQPTPAGGVRVLVHDIAHELGHILALADYFCGKIGHPDYLAPGTRALMNSFNLVPACDPPDRDGERGRPTKLDLDDYAKIYTPAAVTDVETEALLDAVLLRWDQSDVFVESDFEIQRARGAEWLAIESVGANAESAVLAGQPGGAQRYRIVAMTKALLGDPGQGHAYGAASSPVSVHVRSISLLLAGVTHNSATVSWTPLGTVQQYVAKSTKGPNCDAAGEEEAITLSSSDAAEGASGAAGTTVTHSFSGLEPSTAYHLCVRAVRTIEGFVLESTWASTRTETAAAPPPDPPDTPDPPDPPACTSDDSTKPSTTQTVTSTETRWTMSGVYEFKEQRTKSQQQTRSVSWECGTSMWTRGVWGDSGAPTYDGWSATGDERCKDPYAAKPAEARTEPVTEYRWALRGATAHQQKRTGTAHYSRTVTKTGPRACGWTLGEWGSPDRTDWGTWADTGTSEARPASSETEDRGNGAATRWIVGSSSACEEIEQLQRRRTRSVGFSASNGWTTGLWSTWGAPYRVGWTRTGSCLTKPVPATVTVSEQQTRLGPPVFAGPSFCVRYPEKRSRSAYYRQPYVWDASATAWTLGERKTTPYGYSTWTPWTRTGERPQQCAFSALPSGSWSLDSGDYELEWGAQRVLFTVPDDASVELSWRTRDSGGQEAVFAVASEGELAVHPDSLSASSGAASGESSERPTLYAIEDSLTLVETDAD